MYKILVDGNVLYHPLLSNEGHDITSGSVTVELDKTGSATITIPSDNLSYSNISKLKSMIEVYKDNDQIFRGRVLHDDRDFNNNKELYCEGELSFMMDNVFPPYSFTNQSVANVFATFISVYNSQVEQAKQFVVGDVTVTGTVTYTSYDFAVLLDELNARLVDQFGGHIRTRYDAATGIHYIDYLADYTDVCNQAIEFGVNLLDFEEYISAEDLFTVLIPLGAERKDADGNYIGRVNITGIQTGGHEYVSDVDAERIFGNIWKINVWDDVTDPYELKALGEAYLSENVTAATTITLKAVDLSLIDINADAIHLGDGIRVISRPHGIDAVFQCSRINYDLLDPANSEYEFGVPQKSISQQQVDSTNASRSGIESSDAKADGALMAAKQYTDAEILRTTSSYESDSAVAISPTNVSGAYMDLFDTVDAKQYHTVNGETNRIKLGIIADDLVSAMEDAGLSPSEMPIVTSLGGGRYAVCYDEMVALLWKKVQDLQDQIDNL